MSPAGGFDIMAFLPLILIFVVFYFLLIRPQQKKMKAHQELLSSLRRGDKVVTNGGIIGTITKIVSDQEVLVEIADNTQVRFMRSTISEVLIKGNASSSESPVVEKMASVKSKKATPANRSKAASKGK